MTTTSLSLREQLDASLDVQPGGRPMLATAGLTKAFAGNVVLQDVDFEVLAGEIHGLVGENGAGKSRI